MTSTTKYELSRLIAKRMKELEQNFPPKVAVTPTDTLFTIAMREFTGHHLKYNIVQHMPGDILQKITFE
jgi:DNA-directed RNA polymerase subunit K/omega